MKGIHVQTYKSTIVNKILNMNDETKRQIKNLRVNIQESIQIPKSYHNQIQ